MNIEDIESADLDGMTDDELIQMYHSVDARARQLSFAKFMIYNTVDNDLVEKIDDKKQFMQLAIAIAMLTKSKLSDSTGTVKIWDNLIYHMALTDKLVIPPKKHVDMVDNAGGYVREVTPGLYRWPVVFDLTSLYPSIARLLNLSPETQISEPLGGVELVDDVLSGRLRPEDYIAENPDACFAINGAMFDKTEEGIVARAMSFVFYERKRYKDLMKKEKNALEAMKAELHELETQLAQMGS